MAESRSAETIAWLWTIEYLGTLEGFDSSLLDELIELVPDDARQAADEMFQSPLPTKCSLELQIGGLLSDDLLKMRVGHPTTAEIDDHPSGRIGKTFGDLNLQGTESIEVEEEEEDVVLMEIPGGVDVDSRGTEPTPDDDDDDDDELNTSRTNGDGDKPSTAKVDHPCENGGLVRDLNLQGTESIEAEEEDVVLMEIPGGGDVNLQGTEPTPDDDDELNTSQPGRNKVTESNRDHHPAKSSNENGSATNLCGRCHGPGALLECNSANCTLMLHRDCLGYHASSHEEGSGDFYCPLCTHIRAVAEFHEAQRRLALMQENLAAFVSSTSKS